MALDEEGEKAARKLASISELFDRYTEGDPVTRDMREIIFEFETDEDDEDILERALEIRKSQPRAPSERNEPRDGRRQNSPSKKRPNPNSIPFGKLSQPYRFIDLPDQIALPEVETRDVCLDEPLAKGFCATISVDWIADAPLLVGGASTGKLQDDAVTPIKVGGQYVLPGATLRGLVRSVTEIVSYAKMTQGNWHYRFGLRDFVHPYYAEDSGVSKLDQVKGGFLKIREATKDDDKRSILSIDGQDLVYEITCDLEWGHVNIPSLKAFIVPAHTLKAATTNKGHTGYPNWTSLAPFGSEKKGRYVPGKYELLGMGRGEQTDFSKSFTFSLDATAKREKVYNADPNGKARGVMIVAGKLPGGGNKIYEYFIASNPAARTYALPSDTALVFERLHSRPAKGDKLEAEGSWATLRKIAMKQDGDGIPVFHVGLPDLEAGDDNFFFGLTRLFKVPHKRAVRDVLFGEQPNHMPKLSGNGYENKDFAENLFGYVIEDEDWLWGRRKDSTAPGSVAQKGRIAFGFAPLSKGTPAALSSTVDVIQMAPRASYAPFYLRGKEKDYSGQGAKIAGRKAYFPRYGKPSYKEAIADFKQFGEKQKQDVRDSSNGQFKSQDVLSHLKFLLPQNESKPLSFTGEIRLHNVSAAEIGSVLYAITHGGDHEKAFRHMIGRGKPFGAGQMRIGRVILQATPNDPKAMGKLVKEPQAHERYDPATGKGFAEPDRGVSLEPFLDAFKAYMKEAIGPLYPDHSAAIKEWLGMSSPEEGSKLAEQKRLFYKAYEGEEKRNGKPFTSFEAYSQLRQATQAMNSKDAPMGNDRLLQTPTKAPKKT
nr:TIGR03986 family CRISPR-associated RAMP protein [uncultured Cohaesibacter sp.]